MFFGRLSSNRLLEVWSARDSHIFGNAPAAQVRRFLDSSKTRPVRVRHNIDRGRVAGVRNGHFIPSNLRAEGSPFVWNAVLGFSSVFAIMDANRWDLAFLKALYRSDSELASSAR